MILELDDTIRPDAPHRILRLPMPLHGTAGSGWRVGGSPGGAARIIPAAGGARTARSGIEDARLGLCAAGRPLQPATLRVIETTWRLWREPVG